MSVNVRPNKPHNTGSYLNANDTINQQQHIRSKLIIFYLFLGFFLLCVKNFNLIETFHLDKKNIYTQKVETVLFLHNYW